MKRQTIQKYSISFKRQVITDLENGRFDSMESARVHYITNVQDVEFVLHSSCGCSRKLFDCNLLTHDAGCSDLATSGGCSVTSGVG